MTSSPADSSPADSSTADLSTGRLSPVSIDSSTPERPSSTRPSVAICSPGRTVKRIPGRRAATSSSGSRSDAGDAVWPVLSTIRLSVSWSVEAGS